MILLRIGALHWFVFVTKDVLDFLNDWGRAKQPKVSMASLLINSVPLGGPKEGNPIVCKPVAGSEGLFYFRKGKTHGEKVRVFWFYGDEGRRHIVCVRGCVKTQRRLDPGEIKLAQMARSAYAVAVSKDDLSIQDGVPALRRKQ